MDENDRKRDNCVYKNDEIRMSDDDLFALFVDLPNKILDKVGLANCNLYNCGLSSWIFFKIYLE